MLSIDWPSLKPLMTRFTMTFYIFFREPMPKRHVAHWKRARAEIVTDPEREIGAKRFAFSVLAEGLNLGLSRELTLSLSMYVVGQPQTSEYTHVFMTYNIKLYLSWSSWRDNAVTTGDRRWIEAPLSQWMVPGLIVATPVDVRWNFRTALPVKSMDFGIVVKTSGRIRGDFTGPSNGMEREALLRIVPHWKGDPWVVGYCHDNDGKTRRIIADTGWNIHEYLDRNHIAHSFDKAHNAFKSKKLLWRLKEHPRRWLLTLICEDITLENKSFYWQVVTVEHYTGCHVHRPRHGLALVWRYQADPAHVEALSSSSRQVTIIKSVMVNWALKWTNLACSESSLSMVVFWTTGSGQHCLLWQQSLLIMY